MSHTVSFIGTRLTMLRTRHRQEAGREIDVFPAELELLGLPQAGVDGDGGHRPLFFADGVAECSLLVVGEEPDPLVVLLEELDGLDGVHVRLAVADGDSAHPAARRACGGASLYPSRVHPSRSLHRDEAVAESRRARNPRESETDLEFPPARPRRGPLLHRVR